MKLPGLEVEVNDIDTGYINSAFTLIRTVIENIEPDEMDTILWGEAFPVIIKYEYEDGEFNELIDDMLSRYADSIEGVSFTHQIDISEESKIKFNRMVSFIKAVFAAINPNDAVNLFYDHMSIRHSNKQAFVATLAELMNILNAMEDVIAVFKEEEVEENE